MAVAEVQVAIVGGGVVGVAVLHALARREVTATLLEAEDAIALGASATNSGILHTGFDSSPGELETRLILRSAELRDGVLERLSVPVLRCGAVLTPHDEAESRAVVALGEKARANGVEVVAGAGGQLEVPGEAVTDPVAYALALAAASRGAGAEVRTGARVEAIRRDTDRLVLSLAGDEHLSCRVAINCAGLHGDAVARLAGDDTFAVYPRKGEFFVFDPPGGQPLRRILLPVPSGRTKGVLVFPTIDGKVIAGPTAHDQEDKGDWSVRPQARDEVMAKAHSMLPGLEGAEPVASYAGLRPAGRGVNYVIGPSRACPPLINVAAIRSTGLSASLGIGEHVTDLVAAQGIRLGPERELAAAPSPPANGHGGPWWQRAARYREGSA